MNVDQIFFAIWFFLPVGIANCTPIIVSKIPILKQWSQPIDFYQTYREKRILGNHKTIRGLFTGILAAILMVILQQYLYSNTSIIKTFVSIDYSMLNPVIFGTVCAIGALLGDMAKSFIKRQFSIPPGSRWFPFDQLDYIIGGIIATSFVIRLSFFEYGLIVIVWFILHIVSSKIGYFLKLKSVPY